MEPSEEDWSRGLVLSSTRKAGLGVIPPAGLCSPDPMDKMMVLKQISSYKSLRVSMCDSVVWSAITMLLWLPVGA